MGGAGKRGLSSLQAPVWFYNISSKRNSVRNSQKCQHTTRIHTCALRTQPIVANTRTPWWRWWMLPHPLMRPERCSRSGDTERASRSAVWASSPAPDNFTIPALAGGDNHIRLSWQEALNSAPVPLRVWHPAVPPEHAADVTMRRFVFSFFFLFFF